MQNLIARARDGNQSKQCEKELRIRPEWKHRALILRKMIRAQ
jgi:hypothetical protein